MKNYLVLALMMIAVVTANAEEKKSRKEKKAEKKAALVEQTKQIIEDETWYFDATQMLPSKGASRSIINYSVIIEDGNIDSYLPYMGRAYSAGYDGSDSPLIFETELEDYSISETKKGGYQINFKAKNNGEIIEYKMNISESGSATLSVHSTKRQHISYFGNIVPVYENQIAENK